MTQTKQNVLAPATNQEASTTQGNKPQLLGYQVQWVLIFRSYAVDEDNVPLEFERVTYTIKPSQREIDQLRKSMNSLGFILCAQYEKKRYFEDEF